MSFTYTYEVDVPEAFFFGGIVGTLTVTYGSTDLNRTSFAVDSYDITVGGINFSDSAPGCYINFAGIDPGPYFGVNFNGTYGQLQMDWAGETPSEIFYPYTSFTNYDPYNYVQAGSGGSISVSCFCAGTMILTPFGSCAVETMLVGDLVMTGEGVAEPVRWIGRQTVMPRFADRLSTAPIRVRAGAIADAVPLRDLLISPSHAIAIDGILVEALALVNGTSITQSEAMPEIFVYYHIELASHALILAEGLATETFVDNADRANFDNWAEHQALYGDLAEMCELEMPRAKSRRQVPRGMRERIDARVAPLAVAA